MEKARKRTAAKALAALMLAVCALVLACAPLQSAQAAYATRAKEAAQLSTQSFSEETAAFPQSADALALGRQANVELNSANNFVQWFSFTPPANGAYVFWASDYDNDPYAALYRPAAAQDAQGASAAGGDLQLIASDDDSGLGMAFMLVADQLEANTTYYLACSHFDNDEAHNSYKLAVRAYDAADISSQLISYTTQFWLGQAVSTDTLELSVSTPARNANADAESAEDDQSADDEASTSATEETYRYSDPLIMGQDYEFAGWYTQDGARLARAPSTAGAYLAKLRGKGAYHGEVNLPFSIMDAHDLASGYWRLNATNFYDGYYASAERLKLSLEPAVEASKGTAATIPAPKLGSGFKVSAWYSVATDAETGEARYTKLSETPHKVGNYQVEIEGTGAYRGKLKTGFKVLDDFNIADYMLVYKSQVWATKSPLTLGRMGLVLHQHHDTRIVLKAGTDYDMSAWRLRSGYDEETGAYNYTVLKSAPKDPGVYYVTISGKGYFKGTRPIIVTIKDPADLQAYDIDWKREIAYDGEPISTADLGISISRHDALNSVVTLAEGADYTIAGWDAHVESAGDGTSEWSALESVSDVCEIGDYRLRLQGTGSIGGQTAIEFSIVDASDLSHAAFSGVQDFYYLTSKTLTFAPEVRAADSSKLAEGKDYSLSLARWNDDLEEYEELSPATASAPGEYRLCAQAVDGGKYTGSCTKTFDVYDESARPVISADTFYIDNVQKSYRFTAKRIAPEPIVRSLVTYGESLAPNIDYKVSYSSNRNAGTARVKVNATGNYKGKLTKSFKITKAPNTLLVSAKKKTVKMKAKKLAKKARRIANIKVLSAKGKLSYTNASTKKKARAFKIGAKGKLKIPKNTQRGTYKIKIKVRAAGTQNYKPATKTVAFTIKVR